LLHLVGFFFKNGTMMHGSTNINRKLFVSINVSEKLKQLNLVLIRIILYSLIMWYITDHPLQITVVVEYFYGLH